LRKPGFFVVLMLCVAMVAGSAAPKHAPRKVRHAPADLSPDELRTVRLFQKIRPTVVTITVRAEIAIRGGVVSRKGLGSGVLVGPAGRVLTAAHVVADARAIDVKISNGSSYPARVVYSQSRADIALLELEGAPVHLPAAPLGDSDRLAIGQRTYVVGSPGGLENSFTVGIISGFREFDRLYDGTVLAEYIQTDAAINSGSSGGPTFDSKGRVIGIASRILSRSGGSEGLGFVVAINTAKALLSQSDHPWVGIEAVFLDHDAVAKLLNRDLEGGLLVIRVASGSPADRAGLRGGSIPAKLGDEDVLLGGDLIIVYNGQEACHAQCLIQSASRAVGADHIPVTFLRNGVEKRTVIDVSKNRRNLLAAGR